MQQKKKNKKRWNLREIEMSWGKREARNVGRAIAEERRLVNVCSVSRHIKNGSLREREINGDEEDDD